jgi:hypothetical protein
LVPAASSLWTGKEESLGPTITARARGEAVLQLVLGFLEAGFMIGGNGLEHTEAESPCEPVESLVQSW